MMGFAIQLLVCSALLKATCVKALIPQTSSRREPSESSQADSVESDENKSFLAGENTPVWLAYYKYPDEKIVLSYQRLDEGIVKKAVDYWKSEQFQTGLYLRMNEDRSAAWERDSETVTLQESSGDTIYPSVLAVTEFTTEWYTNETAREEQILRRIIYTLAFWNGVDLQFRPISHPRVRVRLAGIVIGLDRDESNHMFESYRHAQTFFDIEGTLNRLNEFWGDRARQKLDFLAGSYNIVALMTDERPLPRRVKALTSTTGPPCDHYNPGATGVLIVRDNLNNVGIPGAVEGIARILGHGSDNNTSCDYKSDWKNRQWKACDVESIRESIRRKGFCMKEPQEYNPPGKPVDPILPGAMMSTVQQCNMHQKVLRQRGSFAVCGIRSCSSISCREDSLSRCKHNMPAIDGTVCGKDMLCLNEKCVSTETLAY